MSTAALRVQEVKNIQRHVICAASAHTLLGHATFVDTRHQLSEPSWGKNCYDAGHIPGALFMHLDSDLSAKVTGKNGRHPLPDREVFIKKLQHIGVSTERPVIIYDQDTGAFAARLWWMLCKWLDYKNVSVLDGGLNAWAEARYAVTDLGCNSKRKRGFVKPRPNVYKCLVMQQQVRENLQLSAFQIVDARGHDRYCGDVEPMDAVAGHIPNSLNRPFTENVDARGRFKCQADLRRDWEKLLNDRPSAEIVHQCGSGVTACHNLLAMEHAGLTGSRLYAGSWSEWCSDPTNHMVVGSASN